MRISACFLALLSFGTGPTRVEYIDDTEHSKINFKLENSPTSEKYLPETMGGGVAVLDYDNDGRLVFCI